MSRPAATTLHPFAKRSNEPLEQFLTQCGLAWSVIPWERHVSLSHAWVALYGNFTHWLRHKQGEKAQFEYSRQVGESIAIVPFLGKVFGPFWIDRPGPDRAAYECHGVGTLPDLSAFAKSEFFIVPDDFGWTMMHTHEDYALGGPYFVRKDWLGPPRNKQA